MTDSLHPLRAWRKGQTPPMTLAALAEKLGTSKGNLSRIEAGNQPMSIDMARRARDVTGLSLSALLPEMAREFAPEPAE